ncbi:MAG: transposase [Oligoflexia bacterium]|nr:transposase [Oligoflexia bacterium]
MSVKRSKHTAKLKGKIAIEALKGDKTISEIASKNNLHPTQVTRWKTQLSKGFETIFDKGDKKTRRAIENREADLFEEIGRLKFELDWLKKKLLSSTDHLRYLIEHDNEDISVRRQCELIGISRSGLYYLPTPETEENLAIMKMIDKQ